MRWLAGRGRPLLLTLAAVACLMAGVVMTGGVSLHSASGAHSDDLPDPVRDRPAPKLPPITTAPLTLNQGQTVVSLTFDDGRASMAVAARILHEHGLLGTFFLISGNIGKPEYLSLPEVDTMGTQGQEIGGHTVNHPDLGTLSLGEVKNQICGDRDTWLKWGFPVRNFAYPFSSATAEVEQIVHDCGYNSARSLGEARTVHIPENTTGENCALCGWAEDVPPPDPYYTRAPAQVRSNWMQDELQAQVSRVTDGDGSPYSGDGGWVQLTFHGICTGSIALSCSDIATPEDEFESFVDWLADQQAQGKLLVRTVGEVIGGDVHPAVAPPPPPGTLVNGDLSANKDGMFSCWQRGGNGNNRPEYYLAPGRNGGLSERVLVHDYHDGEAGLLSAQDLGTCAVAVTPGTTPTMTAWYRSTVPSRFVVHYRTDRGNWSYSSAGPVVAPSPADWTLATWKAPPVPKNATAISFGLVISSNGELTTDDYGLQK